MKTLLLAVSLLVATPSVMAEEDHGLGKIVTEDMDLSYIDHVLAGRIGDRTVYAMPLEGEFGMRLMHRAGGQDFATEFRKVDSEFVASVDSLDVNGNATVTDFRVTEINGEEGWLKGTLSGKPFSVQISSDTMDGHHYIEPHFAINVGDIPYEFVLAGSQACMGCAVKLTFAILSMLDAYGVFL